jgi:predicted Fe-Mo cluster-binding NifX family protein
MKIAAITEDERTISRHFGRAPFYLVVTVEEGKIIARELRKKAGHAEFADAPHDPAPAGQPHGMGPGAESRHVRMAQGISDCQVLLCGGMGLGAYESMRQRGIRPIVTDIEGIDEAVAAYLDGSIVDQVSRLH